MEARIRKWGNSLGLRVPKAFAEEIGIEEGSAVELTVEHGELVVRTRRPRPLRLDALLAGVTEDNRHDEVRTGLPRGKEIW